MIVNSKHNFKLDSKVVKMPEISPPVGTNFQVLVFEQVDRLHQVMETSIPIYGRGNFPTLYVRLKDFVRVVRDGLIREGVTVRDVRLNGGAASYVLCNKNMRTYNDLDLIFGVPLNGQADLHRIRDVVLHSLLDFLPDNTCRDRMTSTSLNEGYVHKMVKIFNDVDRWSLISLSNIRGKNVELKFADTMKRQFEFSVDSFQIILDSLLTFYDVSDESTVLSRNCYPTVTAESVYGSFATALDHLERRLIATRNPEEIRGGGLLKYCQLIVRGYEPATSSMRMMEKYMCSRFFIDFSTVNDQKTKLENYLADHFSADEELTKYNYLMVLFNVVNESTICLMGHERRQTLDLIHAMANQVFAERYKQPTLVKLDQLKNNFIVDQIYYGPFTGPTMSSMHASYPVYTYDYNKQTLTLNTPFSSHEYNDCQCCPEDCTHSTPGYIF